MAYLKDIAAAPPVVDVVDFYLAAKASAATKLIGTILSMFIYIRTRFFPASVTALCDLRWHNAVAEPLLVWEKKSCA